MKERASEARFDFRGGINLSASQDSLDPHELLQCTNARVLPSGAVQRRAGITKTHSTTLGAGGKVRGVFPHSSAQTIAIANGRLYRSTSSVLATWTEVIPAGPGFSTSVESSFAQMLNTGFASPLTFIASGGHVYTWDGGAVTQRDGTASVPAATVCCAFGSRMFYAAGDTLYWSKIGDGTVCTTGGISDGGSARLDLGVFDTITHLEALGSSLLVASPHAIARFTGTGDDIQISQDTFGLSAEIGPVNDVGAYCSSFKRIGDVIFMMTDRGPYIVTEGGITSLADKLQSQGLGDSTLQWRSRTEPCRIAHVPQRFEVWFFYKATGDSLVTTALVYNYATQAWYGPMQMPVEVYSAGMNDQTGNVFPVIGCTDGFVRKLDDTSASRDDGATDYTHTVRFAPTVLGAGPYVTKSMRRVYLQVQRANANTLPIVKVYPDGGAADTGTLVSTDGAVNTPTDLRYDVNAQGKRFVVEVSGAYADGADGDLPQVHGLVVEGSKMDRI